MPATFTAAFIGATFGNGKHMASLFNGSGSGRVLRVYQVGQLVGRGTAAAATV